MTTQASSSAAPIYRLLGKLEIGVDGHALFLPSGNRRAVLAALVLHANRVMSTRELLRAGWGQRDVEEIQLQKCIVDLRKLLAQLGRRGDLVNHPRVGYELRVANPDDVDVLRFRRLVRDAEQAATAQPAEEEVGLLRLALGLWRGEHPMANVPHHPFEQELNDLRQRRRRAALRLFELEIGREQYAATVDDLSAFTRYFPTDHRLCALLMIALHRTGESDEALAAYERYQRAREEASAATPEPVLRALKFAIINGDESAIADLQAEVAPNNTGPPRRSVIETPQQLPPAPADFVGRGGLTAEASWLLSRESRTEVPIVVISGPGGIGKTALASHIAHQVRERYPGGQLHVELRGNFGQPLDTSEALAQFLRGFGAARVPETKAERVALYRSIVADRQVLVLLDDAANEAQIRDLIPSNPACGVLVTARQKMPDIDGTHHIPPLEPLDPEIATQLFRRVIGRAGVELPDEPEAIRDVVALCAGLPLALCIAGALRVRDVGQSTAQLAQRLELHGPDAFVYGERSLASSIGAGFDRLDEHARRLFLGLGLLRLPEFGPWTAAAVLDRVNAESTDALLQLASSYMIQPAGADMRYRFHDLTREYAYRRALREYPDAGDRYELTERVYGTLLTLTRRAHRGFYGSDFDVVHSDAPDRSALGDAVAEVDRDSLAWFEKERLNIRAAVSHCAELQLAGLSWDLAVSSHEFYGLADYYDDWYATHVEALAACRAAGDSRGEGILLVHLGQPALVESRRGGAVSGPAQLQRAVDLLTECGDRHGRAIALRTLANALRRRGQITYPLALLKEACIDYEASGDPVGHWQALRFIGQTDLDLGNIDEALTVLRTAKQIAQRMDSPRMLAQSCYWLGRTYLARGDVAQARDSFQVVQDVYGEGVGVGQAYAAHGLGDTARLSGELAEAQQLLEMAARLAREAAAGALEGRVLLSIAALHGEKGEVDEQVTALEQAAASFHSSDSAFLEAQALAELGHAEQARANSAAAELAWDRVETLYAVMNLPDEDRVHRQRSAPGEPTTGRSSRRRRPPR